MGISRTSHLSAVNMRTFILSLVVVAVTGDAKPYTIGQVAAGLTNGGIITSVGGQAVVPHRAPVAVPNVYTVPHVYGAHHVYYGKRSADPYTIGQVAAGQTNGGIITSVGGVPVVPHHAPVAGAAVPHVYTAGVAHHVPLVY